MPEPIETSTEGTLTTTKAILFMPSAGDGYSAFGKVKSMQFINSAAGAFHIDIYRRISDTSGDVLLYALDLDSGDFVVDSTEYFLGEGGAILGKANVATVNYFINVVKSV